MNITKRTKELFDLLKVVGFNDITFDDMRIEDIIFDADEESTYKSQEEYKENYCIFILSPAFPIGNEYSSFNEDWFLDDLMSFMINWYGDNVTINFYNGCNEYEVIRNKQ